MFAHSKVTNVHETWEYEITTYANYMHKYNIRICFVLCRTLLKTFVSPRGKSSIIVLYIDIIIHCVFWGNMLLRSAGLRVSSISISMCGIWNVFVLSWICSIEYYFAQWRWMENGIDFVVIFCHAWAPRPDRPHFDVQRDYIERTLQQYSI